MGHWRRRVRGGSRKVFTQTRFGWAAWMVLLLWVGVRAAGVCEGWGWMGPYWDNMRYPVMKWICIMIWEYIWDFQFYAFSFFAFMVRFLCAVRVASVLWVLVLRLNVAVATFPTTSHRDLTTLRAVQKRKINLHLFLLQFSELKSKPSVAAVFTAVFFYWFR